MNTVSVFNHHAGLSLKVFSSLSTGVFTDSSLAGSGSKYAGLESEPELSDLMNEVASKVSAKWKEISIQLGLTFNDQECFADATGDNAMKCFALVINAWKSRATRPYTWSTVIEVLNAPAVAEIRLAQELRTKYTHQLSS